jgi:hypothetical protein
MDNTGIIRRITYSFALFPVLTDDIGWVWGDTYQVVEIDRFFMQQTLVIGRKSDWFQKTWQQPTASRPGGRNLMMYEPVAA